METVFQILLQSCGLSHREAAEFLDVRPDTIKSWSSGRRAVPEGAVNQILTLLKAQAKAAQETVRVIQRNPYAETIELGYASDDAEAQGLGWFCVGAQMGALRKVLELLMPEEIVRVKLVPRGSTPGTAAAADQH
ncbi:MAG: hypothetical protein M3O22_00380 [Pseudomonadota bacterium]|nr:hypothetical protein [Pseudomonadota bacterium]